MKRTSYLLLFFNLFLQCDNPSSNIKMENLEKAKENRLLREAVPEMTFVNKVHDFGKSKSGVPQNCEFKFKNTGKSALLILNAEASCGCTIPEYTKEPIAPGKEGVIKVVFTPSGKGIQSKSIDLTTNTKTGRETLTVKALLDN